MKFEIETDSPRGLSTALNTAFETLTTEGSHIDASHIAEIRSQVDRTIEKHLTVGFGTTIRYGVLDELATAFANGQEYSLTNLNSAEGILREWLKDLDSTGRDEGLRIGIEDILSKTEKQIQDLTVLEGETNEV